MLQENQESDEPPRQSASFRVLQEILETGAASPVYTKGSFFGNVNFGAHKYQYYFISFWTSLGFVLVGFVSNELLLKM